MGSLQPPSLPDGKSILFFDGVCNLCNGFVDFVLRFDKQNRFLFSSLQGEAFKAICGKGKGAHLGSELAKVPVTAASSPSSPSSKMDSVILWKNRRFYRKSQAVIMVLCELGGIWRTAGLLLLVPAPVSDWFYDFVARHRYAWFGKRETCRIPTAEERRRFLD